MNWNDSFMGHAVDVAKIYQLYPEKILICMRFESLVNCLNESYLILVKKKELEPIENISKDEKIRYWNISVEYSQDRKHRERVCRSIYLLDKLTK